MEDLELPKVISTYVTPLTVQNEAYTTKTTRIGLGTQTQENHRPHLISIERLILQTICFNFNLHRSPLTISSNETEIGANPRDVFAWTFRLGSALGGSCYLLFSTWYLYSYPGANCNNQVFSPKIFCFPLSLINNRRTSNCRSTFLPTSHHRFRLSLLGKFLNDRSRELFEMERSRRRKCG